MSGKLSLVWQYFGTQAQVSPDIRGNLQSGPQPAQRALGSGESV